MNVFMSFNFPFLLPCVASVRKGALVEGVVSDVLGFGS